MGWDKFLTHLIPINLQDMLNFLKKNNESKHLNYPGLKKKNLSMIIECYHNTFG